ncbi:DUF488 domain-containing protein [Kocuria rhizophila]|uniref:DUF488 domain-containing protein n=1 Tax=Kocuria rhizophila (strain ATCC 9341 / DSM 348 / NBRC 103217 / DC2201) TaxID=378753 RepID=B2GJS7_KOCRD|nr:DUF488 family protein [Kocuria rhizophila]ASE11536.1 DUF488 domain-containing protein [Kocuria rhizophila]BAG28426.1 hypothetical protein KRH_00790 [Kocuria rhizophila DC2201]VEH73958.1 Uncharacterized conserved protein [Kocuria rhizophila]
MDVVVKRIYDEPAQNDGTRVLVDRVWPRGIRKADAHLDDWNKEVSPSTELRKWYGHDPEKFEEFSSRYRKELESGEGKEGLQKLRDSVKGKRLTLLTASKAVDISQATVLKTILSD